MNLLHMSLQFERAVRVQSAADEAQLSPDRTPAVYKKVLKHISAEIKKIIKNLSCGRSRDDVLRIGHEVGGPCSPARSPRPSESGRRRSVPRRSSAGQVAAQVSRYVQIYIKFFNYALRAANIMPFSRRRSVGMNHFCRPDPVHSLPPPLGYLHCTSGRYEVLSLHPECLFVLTSFRLAAFSPWG